MQELGQKTPDPLDWEVLYQSLREEWQAIDETVHPVHSGLYEAYSRVAKLYRDLPVGMREAELFQLLTRVLPYPGEDLNDRRGPGGLE